MLHTHIFFWAKNQSKCGNWRCKTLCIFTQFCMSTHPPHTISGDIILGGILFRGGYYLVVLSFVNKENDNLHVLQSKHSLTMHFDGDQPRYNHFGSKFCHQKASIISPKFAKNDLVKILPNNTPPPSPIIISPPLGVNFGRPDSIPWGIIWGFVSTSADTPGLNRKKPKLPVGVFSISLAPTEFCQTRAECPGGRVFWTNKPWQRCSDWDGGSGLRLPRKLSRHSRARLYMNPRNPAGGWFGGGVPPGSTPEVWRWWGWWGPSTPTHHATA